MDFENLNKDEILYEDEIGFATLGKSVLGHVRVYPKRQVKKVEELNDEEITHLFTIASFAATVVFETWGAQGTNVVAHSNNQQESFYIDVIPRNMNDDLNLRWEPKSVPEPEMEDATQRITDKCDDLKFREENKPKEENKEDSGEPNKEQSGELSKEEQSGNKELQKEKKNDKDVSEEDNVMVKHLERSP